MKRLRYFRIFLIIFFLQIIPGIVLASSGEGLDIPEALDKKVPLEGLSGAQLFFSKIYNENLWLYAGLCVVLMAAVGGLIAVSTDVILKALGLEVEKIEHKE